jgi:hypothetical protein
MKHLLKTKIPAFAGMTKKWLPAILVTIFALGFSSWLMFHTFSYNSQTHEMRIAFKLWSDFGAHIPLIRSFSMGANWDHLIHNRPIEYPIYPGEPIRYHFLFYMIVGLLEKIGVRIDWALNIPSILGFLGLMVSIFLLSRKLFGSSLIAMLSVFFFLFNGSLGFIRFFDTHPLSWQTPINIIQAREFPAFAPWGPGDVTAFWNLNIYTNQRHLAMAFAAILLFLVTLLRIEHMPRRKQLSWAFIWSALFGMLPYFHQPALLILAICMLCYIVLLPKLRVFLITVGILSSILIIPQIMLAQGGAPTISWHPGYTIHNEISRLGVIDAITRSVVYWWHNLGAHMILIPVGFFLIPKQARIILFPIVPLFFVATLFRFSVEVSANHKFFNFVMILGQMISAYTIIRFLKFIHKRCTLFIRLLAYWLIGVLLILLTLSGIIDFFVVKNDIKGTLTDIPAQPVATWITNNTPSDAIFLNSNYLYHPASLAGRAIFLGWPYFAWSAGYLENRMPIMDTLYETRDRQERCTILKQRNISYVTVESITNDTNLPTIDLQYFMATFTPVYTAKDGQYAIFTTADLCK